MSYIYHYNAQSDIHGLDGIIRLEKPILSMNCYAYIKDSLALNFDIDRESLIIKSLTFLHEDDEAPHAL